MKGKLFRPLFVPQQLLAKVKKKEPSEVSKFIKQGRLLRHQDTLEICESLVDAEARVLSSKLKLDRTVKQLDIKGKSVGCSALLTVFESLSCNEYIKTLSFVEVTHLGKREIRALCDYLAPNKTLVFLEFVNCTIGLSGAKAIAKYIKSNQTLERLSFQLCDIGADGIQLISEALKVNTSLHKLYIDSSTFFFGDTGVRFLGDALKVNTGLQVLSLRDQSIGYIGAMHIAEAIEVNTTLRKLDLSYNKLDENCMTLLSDAVKMNTTIINFTCNRPCQTLEDYTADNKARVRPTVTFSNMGNEVQKIVFYYRFGKIGIWDPTTKLLASSFVDLTDSRVGRYYVEYWPNHAAVAIFTTSGLQLWSLAQVQKQAELSISSDDKRTDLLSLASIEGTDSLQKISSPRRSRSQSTIPHATCAYSYSSKVEAIQDAIGLKHGMQFAGYSKHLNGSLLVQSHKELHLVTVDTDLTVRVNPYSDISYPSLHHTTVLYHTDLNGTHVYATFHDEAQKECKLARFSVENRQWEDLSVIRGSYLHSHVTFLDDNTMLLSMLRRQKKKQWYREYYLHDLQNGTIKLNLQVQSSHTGLCVTSGKILAGDGVWHIYLSQRNDIVIKATLDTNKQTINESVEQTETYKCFCYNA